MGILAPGVAVVAQTFDRHQAFDEEVSEFDEEAVFGGIENERGELFADTILHEADFLPLDELAFGFGGAAFGLARLLGDLGKFGFGNGRFAVRSFAVAAPLCMMDDDAFKAFVGVGPWGGVAALGDFGPPLNAGAKQALW